jgi:hypothetical protein
MRHALRWIAISSALSFVAGCGGSKPAEPTLTQQVEAATHERDPEIRARTLIDLSAQQRAMKDNPGAAATMTIALKSALEIKSPATKSEVLLAVAKELIAGNGSKLEASKAIDAARVAVATIADRSEKAKATIDLGMSVKKLGEHDAAVAALNNAQSLTDGVENPEQKAPLLGSLAAARIVTGDKAKADAALKSARELSDGIADPRRKVRTQAEVAAALYAADQPESGKPMLDAAVDAARAITDPQKRGYALTEIFEVLSPFRTRLPLSGLLNEAGEAARQMKELDQQGVLLRRIQSLLSAQQ